MTFPNGLQDDLELTQHKFLGSSDVGCNYLGRLRNDDTSSVAVTGCLDKVGDIMEITLLSKNNINKMYKVDFFGNAEILENPFEHGGIRKIYNSISLQVKIIYYYNVLNRWEYTFLINLF